jgi:hypothetical protein
MTMGMPTAYGQCVLKKKAGKCVLVASQSWPVANGPSRRKYTTA